MNQQTQQLFQTYYSKHNDNNNNNPALFLLHSGGMAGVEWDPQIKYLQKNFCLYIPDLPGHGRTVLEGELTVSKMANAILEIMQKENLKKAHFVGSSMGGAVALYLAINYPEIIDRLVIYRIGYKKNIQTHEQTQSMANPEYWKKFGMHRWLSKLHTPQGDENSWQTVIKNVSKTLDPRTSEHNHSLLDISKISAKTLLIAGDRDPVIPLEVVLEMHKTIANSGLWIMPYTTHITNTNTWRDKEFSDELIRFFR